MTVRYHQRRGHEVPDYQCMGECIQDARTRCQGVPGQGVDDTISQLLLQTVTPLALEVALTVQAELEARADEADQLRATHVQRARHHAELARRRYLSVDPDNRLVADTLEADWNDKLRQLQAAQDNYEHDTAAAHAQLTDQHKTRIRQLAADFPTLWSDPSTPQRERKRIARLLIEDVTLNKTDQIHIHVRFRGGQTTSLTIPLPPRAWHLRQTNPDTLALLHRLLNEHTDAEIAAKLNADGHRSGDGKTFTGRIVLELRRSHGFPSHHERLRAHGLLTIGELADRLGVHPTTINAWRRAGLIQSHKANDKNIRLFDLPHRATRGSSNAKDAGSSTRTHPTMCRRCTMKPTPCRGVPAGADRDRDPGPARGAEERQRHVSPAVVGVMPQPGLRPSAGDGDPQRFDHEPRAHAIAIAHRRSAGSRCPAPRPSTASPRRCAGR